MSSSNDWSYTKAIPAFKKIAGNPIGEAYTPYGLPYYVIIAAMLNKNKMKISTPEYEFEIKNGNLIRVLGPSAYAGSKIDLSNQPRPVFRPWPEYVKTATPIVETNFKDALPEYQALSDKIETLYNSNTSVGGALSDGAISAIAATTPFKTAPDESFYYTESNGFHLELKQPGGSTVLDVKMDLGTGKTKTVLTNRASIESDAAHKQFVNFVVARKDNLEVYAQSIIPMLQVSPQALNDKRFANDIATLEKDIDAFYNKRCKPAIDMLKGANQLQKVI
jgi:hypothetical protein